MRKLVCGFLTGLALVMAASRVVAAGDDPPPALQLNTREIADFLAARQPKPYTRVARPDTNTVALQIAIRKLVPVGREGAEVWLVGTSHIGDESYYHELQKYLDARTVVLYEGVNVKSHARHVQKPGSPALTNEPAETAAIVSTNAGFSLQSELARALGLVFQLSASNYDRTNFLNSDLSAFDIQRLMLDEPDAQPAAPGEEGRSDPTFTALLQVMDGSSFLGSLVKVGVQWIGANEQLRSVTKLTLVEMLGQLKGDFADMRGLPANLRQLVRVLIAARNENVINDLKTEFKTVPITGSIAIFYGTGHMDDMEKRIRDEFAYQPAEDIWLTAFSVDTRKTGLDADQLKWTEKMIKTELQMIQK
jgi:hypothetical protein